MTSTDGADPYWRLRPEGPTPADEVCGCADAPPLVLVERLSKLPIACLSCKGEVPPERIGFDEDLAEKVASWRNVRRALHTLWLDSAEYETSATEQLEDKNGSINIRGRSVVEQLNRYRRAYYWWFQDQSVIDFTPQVDCPLCEGTLLRLFSFDACDPCSIVLAQE